MNDTGLTDFLADNDVDTSFVDDLPTFSFLLSEIVDIYIDN